jgi:hypothetical protein
MNAIHVSQTYQLIATEDKGIASYKEISLHAE